MQNRIYSTDSPKAVKSLKMGYLNAIHYMAPSDMAGVGNLCPFASPACRSACLGWASGQAAMVAHITDTSAQGNSVRLSRIEKAQRFMKTRAAYMIDVKHATHLAVNEAARKDLKLCVRLNGATDISWERVHWSNSINNANKSILDLFPNVQFVDYTKSLKRALRSLSDPSWPTNYHLTFSRSETNHADCMRVLKAGGNVAVVFAYPQEWIGRYWHGFYVIDGDKHDLRHLDEKNVVVALSPKGRLARLDRSGFVYRNRYPYNALA